MEQETRTETLSANELRGARGRLIAAMLLFGTIGVFVRGIALPSAAIALVRGAVGALVLFLYIAIGKPVFDRAAIRANFLRLLLSGAMIGFNWILLFEAYRYTTVATATLCYYLAPTIVVLISPLLLKEKLTKKRLICAIVALIGMIPVSGVLQAGGIALGEIRGVLFGIGAAALYAGVILMNKCMGTVPAMDRTIFQLGSAAIVLFPYVLLVGQFSALFTASAQSLVLLLIVSVLHTGIAYAMYFGSLKVLPAQTVAIVSYLDPVTAVLLSAVLLAEPLGLMGAVGAALILGAAYISER